MANTIVVVISVSDIGKYAKFTLDDGSELYGKYGYFSYLAYNIIGEENISFPIKVRLDDLGIKYFHVEAIWHSGIWVKLKARGY